MARLLALPILPIACLIWVLIPAQASPAPRTDQVVLHLQLQDLPGRAGVISVYFNPKELTVDKSVPWKKGQAKEGDKPPLEFTSGEPKSLSVELMFDLYEDGPKPGDIISSFESLVGQAVPITWNERLWTGTLKASKPGGVRTKKNGEPRQLTMQTLWSDLTLVDPVAEYPFTVEIPGVPDAGSRIREVSIDPVNLPPAPGDAPPRARFTLAAPQGIDPDLLKWQQAWEQGVQVRRAIMATIFTGGVPVRTCTVNAGGPIRLALDDPKAPMPHLTLDVTFDQVKVSSPDPVNAAKAAPLPAYHFEVEIGGVTYDFKKCDGLKIEQGVVEFGQGGIVGPKARLAGTAKWPPLTLVGEPRIPMKGFFEWVDAAAIGQALRQPVKITPVYVINGQPSPTPPLQLQDAVPVQFKFPVLSALWSEGDKTESTRLPPLYGVVK